MIMLPNWVIDLVIAVQEYEDVHAKDWPHCFEPVLEKVPADVRQCAARVAEYQRQAKRHADLVRGDDDAEAASDPGA